ncbi:hypothetical protein [Caballeronia sp. S22]|uniref:hypothetical protein n=1 Tax=Caballeronia sp. S22 TaxID=3137182 RepID=UPI003530B64C
MPKVQSLASSLSLTPEVAAALAKAQAALDTQQQIVFAIRRVTEEQGSAVAALKQSTEDLTRLEKAHVLSEAKAVVDPQHQQEVVRLKKSVDKAREAISTAQSEIDRCERLRPVLVAEAQLADEAIASVRDEIKQAGMDMAKALEPVFSEQVRSAVGQIAKAVSQARAICANLPAGFMREFLNTIRIVDPCQAQIVYLGYGDTAIRGPDLLQLPSDDIDVQAIAAILKPVVDMELKCRTHSKYRPPEPPKAPYQIRGSTVTVHRPASA